MILKYSVLGLLTTVLITASDPYFGTVLTLRPVPEPVAGDVREIPWRKTDAFDSILKDSDERITDAFKVRPYYEPMVRFWFFIYTQFESSQVVFHDKNDLNLIYRVLDFSNLHSKGLPKNTVYVLQQKITQEKIDELKSDLRFVATNPFTLEPRAKRIYDMIRAAGVTPPLKEVERRKYFARLAESLRTQTGQKNFIRDGIVRSLPYQKFLRKYFKARDLPTELLAIPFLESSFNPAAQSKVNALGVWQFMPLIASYFVPKRTTHIDYRSNVGVSSVSAAFLMSENFKILKNWDLAVTAYNSGTKHLLKTKRKLGNIFVDLEAVIKNSDSRHFGFASKNFYTEFLALAHTLAYEEEIFQALHTHDRTDVGDDLHFYLAKCALRLDKVLERSHLDEIRFHNHHIRKFDRTVPRGLILTSKSELPAGKFFKLDFSQLTKVKPRDWYKFIKNQSCSTR